MKHTFETLEDAKNAGYTTALPGIVQECGRFVGVVNDVSGSNYSGLRYALTGELNGPLNVTECGIDPEFPVVAHTVTVELTQEKNQLGQLGAYMAMFEPGAVGNGINQL